jgi:hypothetical protein
LAQAVMPFQMEIRLTSNSASTSADSANSVVLIAFPDTGVREEWMNACKAVIDEKVTESSHGEHIP